MLQQFGHIEDLEILPQETIADSFAILDRKEVDYAVVPLENSTNGQVVFTYDLLRDWFMPTNEDKKSPQFRIVAEEFVSIHHYFLSCAKDVANITKVFLHPQVWGQITGFLALDRLAQADYRKIDTTSTAAAAATVYKDETNTSACVCSKMSAEAYHLPVLFEKIEDNANNTTRFLVLGYDRPPQRPGKDVGLVTSLLFTLNHDDPGALCGVLDLFRKYNVNMTSIHSRPSKKERWQYVFYVELIGDIETDEPVKRAVESTYSSCLLVVVLGSFKRSWRY